MRIDRLDLIAYGPFAGSHLDLSQGNHGLHLICGPNEAGKSSTLRALIDGLFGIPMQTADNFVHSYRDLRIGMKLRSATGESLAFVRRKANQGTLRDPQSDVPLADGLLDPLLGSVDRNLFRSMFGLDHEQLVTGGQQITKLGNDIGQMLFSAAGSMGDVRKVRDALSNRANELFAPQARTRKINQSLSQHRDLQKKLREIRTASSRIESLRREIESLESATADFGARMLQAQTEAQRLSRLAQAREPIAQRRIHRERLAGLADAPRLPTDFLDRVHAMRQAQAKASALRDMLLIRRSELESELERLGSLERRLESVRPIRELLQGSGAHLKAQRDLPTLRSRETERRDEAQRILNRQQHATTLEAAAENRLPKGNRDALNRLTMRYGELTAERQRLEQAQTDIDRAVERAEQDLTGLEPTPDVSLLERTIERLRTVGDPERDAELAATELEHEQRELAAALARLPLWRGSAEQLETCAIPSVDSIAHHDEAIRQATARRTELEAERKRLDDEASRNEVSLAALRGAAGPIPTTDDLLQARARRDRRWTELQRRLGSPIDLGATDSATTDLAAETLAEAVSRFEAELLEADRIADRIWREAQSVADQARLLAEQVRIERRYEQLSKAEADAALGIEQAESDWREAWSGVPIEIATPREMSAWRADRERLLDRLPAIGRRSAELLRLRQVVDDARGSLTAALASVGETCGDEESAAVLWRRGSTRLERIAQQQRLREKGVEKLKERHRERQDNEDQRRSNANATADWRESWAKAVAPLGLSGDATPDHATTVLSERIELERILDELFGREGLTVRINDIERDATSFETAARAAAKGIPEVDGQLPLEKLLSELGTELKRVESAAETRQRLDDELNVLLPRLRKVEEEIALTGAALQESATAAGTTDSEELEERWRRSEARRISEERLHDVETTLVGLAAGVSLDELEHELLEMAGANGEEGSEIAGASRIATLEDEVRELDASRQTARERLGRLRKELDEIGGGSEAITCRGELLQVEAELEADVREYARVRAAAYLLGEAIERFQSRNQGPMLMTAGAMFARLTCGSFDGLTIDHDSSGGSSLVGRRAGSHVEVPISGMSEGTADQLYLALRLAYLAEWLTHHEPLPLIIDDVLIKFDDARAAATLEVLAEFSKRTQVILFTHHEHLIELAREGAVASGGDPTVFVHRLERTAAT